MREKIKNLSQRALEHKFVKFFLSSGTAFLVDLAVLIFISFFFFQGNNYSILGIISLPKLISSSVGLAVSFYLNRNWVFDAKNGAFKKQLPKFIVVSIFNIIFVSILFNFYYEIFNFAFTQTSLSSSLIKTSVNVMTSISSEGTKMFVSFFLYKYVVFRE